MQTLTAPTLGYLVLQCAYLLSRSTDSNEIIRLLDWQRDLLLALNHPAHTA